MSSPFDPSELTVTDDPAYRHAIDRDEHAAASIDVWNLHDGVCAVAGGQDTFNVVGRIHDPSAHLDYSLNGAPWRPVYVRRADRGASRLERPGDFNIDTIATSELWPENRLVLRCRSPDADMTSRSLSFRIARIADGWSRSRPDLEGARRPEEVGQIVEGRWRLAAERGRSCLQVREEDAGYDRVILLARPNRGGPFTAYARLRIDRRLSDGFSAGLVFGWSGHPSGGGIDLPREWTTGLAYYRNRGRGLRLRAGREVSYPDRDGDLVLGEATLSRWRHLASRAAAATHLPWSLPQMRTGTEYHFRLRVDSTRYRLTVWQGTNEPGPQIDTAADDMLSTGAVGVLAHRCAVTLFDLHVVPG